MEIIESNFGRFLNPKMLESVLTWQRQETKKASAKAEPQNDGDEEVYIGREGTMIRRGEKNKETRDRRQDVRRIYRYHRR